MINKLLIILLIVALAGYMILSFVLWQTRIDLAEQIQKAEDLQKQIDNLKIQTEKEKCDAKCKSFGYASGVCRTYPVALDAPTLKCEIGEIALGPTVDCPTIITKEGELVVGAAQTCCCQE